MLPLFMSLMMMYHFLQEDVYLLVKPLQKRYHTLTTKDEPTYTGFSGRGARRRGAALRGRG
jgi:hypothetical protein